MILLVINVVTFKDENIGNHGYIGYIRDISADILKKNIGA